MTENFIDEPAAQQFPAEQPDQDVTPAGDGHADEPEDNNPEGLSNRDVE